MRDNNNFMEGVMWLDRAVSYHGRVPPRKCGRCHMAGHTQPNCPESERLSEQFYSECMDHLQRVNMQGYTLEMFVYSLLSKNLKLLYKKVCGKTMKKKEEDVYEKIFEHFRELNIGYVGKQLRCAQLYTSALQAIENDVATKSHGHRFQHFLKQLNRFQMTELMDKIIGNGGNWIGSGIVNREIYDYRRYNTRMTQFEFQAHCHFAEMNIGYHFSVQLYYLYRSSANVVYWLGLEHELLQVNRMENGLVTYTKQIQFELDMEEEEESDPDLDHNKDCAICYDSLGVDQFVKTGCNHAFCGPCIGQIIGGSVKRQKELLCPMCRTGITNMKYYSVDTLDKMEKKIVDLE